MEETHLLYSILNLAGYVALGLFLATIIKNNWPRRAENISGPKLAIVCTVAALAGGNLGLLVNGAPNISSSIENLFLAWIFALFVILSYLISRALRS